MPTTLHYRVFRPPMDEAWSNRFKKPWAPYLMDYCAPYHCDDYNKKACGLNRNKMKFRWFKSGCHLKLHNACVKEMGEIKYDNIQVEMCTKYVMFARASCPTEEECGDHPMNLMCGRHITTGLLALFYNECYLEASNCKSDDLDAYLEADIQLCEPQMFLKPNFVRK